MSKCARRQRRNGSRKKLFLYAPLYLFFPAMRALRWNSSLSTASFWVQKYSHTQNLYEWHATRPSRHIDEYLFDSRRGYAFRVQSMRRRRRKNTFRSSSLSFVFGWHFLILMLDILFVQWKWDLVEDGRVKHDKWHRQGTSDESALHACDIKARADVLGRPMSVVLSYRISHRDGDGLRCDRLSAEFHEMRTLKRRWNCFSALQIQICWVCVKRNLSSFVSKLRSESPNVIAFRISV